jgi:crossover junction endodeoxyribonuclease RuvC
MNSNGRFETRDGQGALFVNDRKEGEQPDYSGNVRIGGVLYRLAGWKRTSRSGTKWLALKIESDQPHQQEPKRQPQQRAAQPAQVERPGTNARATDDFDDAIPFLGNAVTTCTIGIDPGLSGAIAVLNATGDVKRLDDLPVIRSGRLAWIDGGRLQSILIDSCAGRPGKAIVERVHSMPRQGVASSFTFGVSFGSILSVLQARHLPIELVTASVWKKAMGLTSDKTESLHRARLMFPTADLSLAKHHGRAEALLLAHWALTRTHGAAA